MKKITLAVATSMLLVTGGVQADSSTGKDYLLPSAYVGVAYSYLLGHVVGTGIRANQGFTLNAGYDYNQYLGAEVRFMSTFNTTKIANVYTNERIKNIGVYLKPQYNNEKSSLYGLLGYGKVSFLGSNKNKFQWGLGAKHSFEKSTSFYLDYVRIYDATVNIDTATMGTFNFGLEYSF
jgi:hypothetical protein